MKVAIIGYGKMGHIIEQIARKRGHEIVCIIDKENVSDFESDAFRSAQVAIEFSTPATAKTNILHAWSSGVPVVCGTTGWDVTELDKQKANLKNKTDKEWLIWKSNFSIGVQVLFELNKTLAQLLNPYSQYTPSIKEIHHIHKIDKPSGTAKTLADTINSITSSNSVTIDSIREGEVPGTHTVTWNSEEDTIIIQHIAKGRQGFALGAVLAAEELAQQH